MKKQIDNGTLKAAINKEHGYIEFVEDEGFTTYEMVEYLGEQIKSTMSLHHQIAAFDRGIELSDKWLSRVWNLGCLTYFTSNFIMKRAGLVSLMLVTRSFGWILNLVDECSLSAVTT